MTPTPDVTPSTSHAVLIPHGATADVHTERSYATSASDLWAAVTTAERLAGWLGTVTGDLTIGGRYRLHMSPDPDGDDQSAGEVLVCEPPRRLVVTWEFPGEGRTEVEVIVAEVDGGAVLVLDHRGLSRSQARGYGAGWHTYLDDLATVLAGGTPHDWDARYEQVLGSYMAQLPKEQDAAS